MKNTSISYPANENQERTDLPFKTWTPAELNKMGSFTNVTPDCDMTPAFPFAHDPEDGQVPGMTLLDHIAIQSFTAILPGSTRDVEELVEDSYQYASLMLKERKKYLFEY